MGPKSSSCVIYECKNKKDESKGISLHSFPIDKPSQMKWVEFVNALREMRGINTKMVTPSAKDYLCSLHFEDSDFSNAMQYNMGFAKRKILKKEAIPKKIPNIFKITECEPATHNIIGEKLDKDIFMEEISSMLQKKSSEDGLVKNLNNDIKIEEISILEMQKNSSKDGFVENLNNDIKIEEISILEEKNATIELQDKENALEMDHNKLEIEGIIKNTSENHGIFGSIPEYVRPNYSHISSIMKDETMKEEPSMGRVDDVSTIIETNYIQNTKSKTLYSKDKCIDKDKSQKGYKDKILIAIAALHNNKNVSELNIYKYIHENFAHEGKNEEVISQLVNEGIKELLSTGFIVKKGKIFETNHKSFFEIKGEYKDMILEAIASSTDPSGSDLTCIRNYLRRKDYTRALPFTKRCVEKLLSTGDIIQIGSRLKVSNLSKNCNIEDRNKRTVEASNSKKKSLEHKFGGKNIENIMEIENENKSCQNKKYKAEIDRENIEKITEKENLILDDRNSERELDSDNSDGIEDENYRTKYIDIILSEEMEFKKNRDKIFNEDNYVDCPFKYCDLIVYCEHIEKHLQAHKSVNVTKYGIKKNNKSKFVCTECGEEYTTFYSIANHLFTHFKDKAPNERMCNECGYKNKRLTALKNHKCNNLKDVDVTNSKSLMQKVQLDSNIKKANKKETNAKTNDEDYKPSDDSDHYSSDSDHYSSDNDSEDTDDEKQKVKNYNNELLGKLKVTCTRCQAKFENEALCNEHLKKDHETVISENLIQKEVDEKAGIRIFMCLKCKKIFHNKSSCVNHISVNHYDIEYHCDNCEYVSCRKHLLDHIQRIHDDRISYCKICNKSNKNKKALRVHMFKAHRNNPDQSHLCNICGKVFKRKTNLNIHLLTHSGEKPFACKLCKFSTVQKYNLVVHMRSHERGTIKTSKR